MILPFLFLTSRQLISPARTYNVPKVSLQINKQEEASFLFSAIPFYSDSQCLRMLSRIILMLLEMKCMHCALLKLC